jgi:dipeptidyl aminopeptidase/acylaminoacyl peptidase
VNALKRNSIPVTYVLYPDEGHGFRRTENSLAEAGFIEQFLHKCLSGENQLYKIGMYNSNAQVIG